MPGQPPANIPLTIHPGKLVVQKYPTPNLADRIFVRRMDMRTAKNVALPVQGTAYDGPDPDKYEGFIFATAAPSDQGGYSDWYYLNERANQDAYNFTIDYIYNDKNYPRITRSYVYLRAGLVEPQVNTVDPIFAGLQLTDHKQTRIEDPILDSLFVMVQRVYEVLPGPVITTYNTIETQQVVTVLEQEVASGTPHTPTAVTEISKLERTGTAKAKITEGNTVDVFGAETYTVARDEYLIPRNFKSLIPSILFSQIVAGVAAQPTLTNQDMSSTEKQVTKYKKLVETITRAFNGLVTLVGYILTRDQQVATVTETWSRDPQTITPRPTLVEAEVSNWGDLGTFKKEVETSDVFPEGDFAIDVPDPVPPEFKYLSPTTRIGITEPGTAQLPTLGLGEVAKRETQKTELIKRTETTGRDLSQLPKTLIDQELTEAFGFGGVLDITRTLDTVPQTVDQGILVTASKVRNLTGGLTLKETSAVVGGDAHIDITNGGSGYSSPPTITFADGTTAGGATATAAVSSLAPPDPFTQSLVRLYDGDKNGVFHFLGAYTNNGVWQNPNTAGRVTLSLVAGTLAQGSLDSIVDQQPSNTYTNFETTFELRVDLGSDKNLLCTDLGFRQRSDYNGGVNAFIFWGSNDATTWTQLLSPPNTILPQSPNSWQNYSLVYRSTAYRYFRITRPGSGSAAFTIGELELYGTLNVTPGSVGVEVTGVTVTAGGVYASRPDVVFSGGGGTGATATAVLDSDGAITSIILNTRGTGYTSAPAVSFSGGTGAAGAATAVLGFSVASFSMVSGGGGYAYPPAVILTPVPGDDLAGGAVGTAVLANGVSSVRVTNSGVGYTSTPTVAFSGGSGTGAAGTVVRGFPLATIVVGTAGSGYTTPPTVIIAGDGQDARAHVVFGSMLSTPVLTAAGSGYTSNPALVFTGGGGGTGAAGYGVRSLTIASVTLDNGGSGYTSDPVIDIAPPVGGGVTARATASRSFGVASAPITAGGSGYTTATVAFGAPGAGVTATGTVTLSGGAVTGIVITNPGSGYTSAPTATISGDGTLATASSVLATAGAIDAITITDPGSGYSTVPAVSITGGGGVNGHGTAVLSTAGVISSVVMTNFGSGYTSAPGVTFDLVSGGTGATAICSLGGSSGEISSIVIDNPGSGYTAAPTISFSGGGGGSGAAATSTLGATGTVKAVTITTPGTGYQTPPAVAFSGGGGSGAAGTSALASSGTVVGVLVTNGGRKYKSAPTVTFIPGSSGGTGASALAHLAATGEVIAAILTDPGIYVTAPILTFSGGGGTGAAGVYVFAVGWPVLYETHVDDTTKIVINIRKEIVAAGTKYSGVGFEEIQAVDKWRSIRLTSYVDYSSMPQPEIFSDWMDFPFPNELLSIEATWSTQVGQTRAGQNYDGTFQTVADSTSTSGGAAVLVKHGYRGPSRAEVTRTYLVGPPSCCDLPSPLYINESSGSVVVSGSSNNSKTQTRPTSPFSVVGQTPPPLLAEVSVSASTGIIPVGPFLTGSYVVLGSDQAGGSLVVRIPRSTPDAFVPGTTFIARVTVTKMRFEIWMIDVYRITVPPDTCACGVVVGGGGGGGGSS